MFQDRHHERQTWLWVWICPGKRKNETWSRVLGQARIHLCVARKWAVSCGHKASRNRLLSSSGSLFSLHDTTPIVCQSSPACLISGRLNRLTSAGHGHCYLLDLLLCSGLRTVTIFWHIWVSRGVGPKVALSLFEQTQQQGWLSLLRSRKFHFIASICLMHASGSSATGTFEAEVMFPCSKIWNVKIFLLPHKREMDCWTPHPEDSTFVLMVATRAQGVPWDFGPACCRVGQKRSMPRIKASASVHQWKRARARASVCVCCVRVCVCYTSAHME